MLQLFDDGSSITIDDQTGDVTAGTDNTGAPVLIPSPGAGIGQQFLNLVTYGVRSVIDNKLPPAPAPRLGVQAAPGVSSVGALFAQPMVKFGALALLGVFLYKKFA